MERLCKAYAKGTLTKENVNKRGYNKFLDISGLATGMYVMKVALDDGKVFEEKIVKE